MTRSLVRGKARRRTEPRPTAPGVILQLSCTPSQSQPTVNNWQSNGSWIRFASDNVAAMKAKTPLEIHSRSSGTKRNFGFTRVPGILGVSLWIALAATISVRAGSLSLDQTGSSSVTESNGSASTRYGLFGWLDHRSGYGQGVFPEPFLVDDSDLETNEARLDWLHTTRNDHTHRSRHRRSRKRIRAADARSGDPIRTRCRRRNHYARGRQY